MDSKDLEIVAQGEFFDEGYHVKTLVIRLLGELRQEELDAHEWNDRCCYETEDEWRVYHEAKQEKHKRLEEKVRGMIGLGDSESFVLSNSLSEIFTVVAMYSTETQYGEEN